MNTTFKKTSISTVISACTLAMALGLGSASAVAASHDDSATHQKGGSGGHSDSNHDQGGKGQANAGHNAGSSLKGMRQGRKDILDILADDNEESDRPSWAGQPGNEGKPGGGNAGDSRKKGGDYGDIIVLQRNDDGTPVTTTNENGDVITYAVASDGSIITIVNGEIPEGADVQAVEFGRLNVARSPEKVLDHSLAEALSKLNDGTLGDTVTLDPAGRLVVDGVAIDSPLENLALYQALLATPAVDGTITLSVTSTSDGQSTTYSFSVPEDARMELAAATLAAASDKTGDLTVDEVYNISSFLGVNDELSTYLTAGAVNDYNRDTTYAGVEVPILDPRDTDGDGVIDTYVPISADVLTHVDFNQVDATSILNNTTGGIDVFTQMADDALQVLEFVHDNALE